MTHEIFTFHVYSEIYFYLSSVIVTLRWKQIAEKHSRALFIIQFQVVNWEIVWRVERLMTVRDGKRVSESAEGGWRSVHNYTQKCQIPKPINKKAHDQHAWTHTSTREAHIQLINNTELWDNTAYFPSEREDVRWKISAKKRRKWEIHVSEKNVKKVCKREIKKETLQKCQWEFFFVHFFILFHMMRYSRFKLASREGLNKNAHCWQSTSQLWTMSRVIHTHNRAR